MGEEGYPEDYPLPDYVGWPMTWDAKGWKRLGYTGDGGEMRIFPHTNHRSAPAKAYNYGIQYLDFTGWDSDKFKRVFGGGSVTTTSKLDEYQEVQKMINDMSRGHGNPDDMEAAALRLATLAQEIRIFQEREPQGEEPVISWKHSFTEGGPAYTYVAVKLGERWYVTGDRQSGKSFAWRDFMSLDWAKALVSGNFHLVTEWTEV